MRRSLACGAALATFLGGCTHANVSSIPIYSKEHGELYRYTGRANFGFQLAEADKSMTEHCTRVNGGRPVVVNVQKQYIGDVAFGNASSTTTGSAVASGGMVSGSATTMGQSTVTTMANHNQEVLFKCEAAVQPSQRQ